MFVLALRRSACARSVAAEQSFSVVAGPVHGLYEIAQPMLLEASCIDCWFHWDWLLVLRVAVSYTLSASWAWSNGSWHCWLQHWLASRQIATRPANEGKLLCGKFWQVNLIVIFPILRCPVILMNVVMWEHCTSDCENFRCGKVY
jgi:hypothetical protein